MATYLLVAAGGALGAVARFAAGAWITAHATSGFPWATLGINVAGSLVLGAVLGLFPEPASGMGARALLGVGFCGAFTTFSAFGHETLLLVGRGLVGSAALYIVGSVLLGVAGVAAGLALGTALR